MRKSFWIAFGILFFCAMTIGAGVFWMEKKIKNSEKNLMDTAPADELSIIKNNIKDGGISLPRQQDQSSATPAENIQEKQETEASAKEESVVKEPIKESAKEVAPETVTNKFSFGILGDTQRTSFAETSGFYKAVKILKEKNPEFLVAVGDLLSSCDGKSGCQGKMDSWKKVLDSVR